MQFILWDPNDGRVPMSDGEINTNGILGRLDENNVYLRTYAVWPEGAPRYTDLSVGATIHGVRFGLSGERGVYNVIRVA